MKATRGNCWSLRAPLVLAAACGLALSASGCIIESSSHPDIDGDGIPDIDDECPTLAEDYNGFQDNDGCPDGGSVCLPDLTIYWRLISNIDQTALTCAQAGGADTITAQIDGGAYGSNLHSFPTACPSSAKSGSFKVELPASGSYNVSLELTAGATLLSETNVLVQPVDCSGLTVTPEAPLYVNF
jgi:hypothetical protein